MNSFHHCSTTMNLMKNKSTKWVRSTLMCTFRPVSAFEATCVVSAWEAHGFARACRISLTLTRYSRCSIAGTRGLRSGRRIWCGNRSRDGHTHQQTWFYGRFRKSGHRLCARLGNAVLLPLFFSLVLYNFQIVDAISWQKRKMVADYLMGDKNNVLSNRIKVQLFELRQHIQRNLPH